MEPMVMSYKFKPASMLRQVAPGDSISAEVVVVEPDANNRDAGPDYWLENVKVTGHAKSPPAKGPGAMHIPQSGEEVPDFSLTNQDGKRVSLKQYRGKVLLVTFIYTRCPFQDFCPRMSRNFDEIYKQMGDEATHLLSISFDPDYDTPKVLRSYGAAYTGKYSDENFAHWEFASGSADEVKGIAQFFGMRYYQDSSKGTEQVIHSLDVVGVQARGGLVEDIGDVGERGAEVADHLDTLRLAARQRAG